MEEPERPAKRTRLESQGMDDLLANLHSDDFAEDWDETADAREEIDVPVEEADLFGVSGEDDLFEADLLALSSPPRVASAYEDKETITSQVDVMQVDQRPPSPDAFYEQPEPIPTGIPAMVGFVVGRNQRPVPQASKEALERARRLIESIEAEAAEEMVREREVGPAPAETLAPLCADSSQPMSSSAVTMTRSPVRSLAQSKASAPQTAVVATPLRSLRQERPALDSVKHNIGSLTPRQTPDTGNRFRPPSKAVGTPINAPKKGLNLGMTPRRHHPSHMKPFKTPFKKDLEGTPKRETDPSTPERIHGNQENISNMSKKPKSKLGLSRKVFDGVGAVFDLNAPKNRYSMAEYGLVPQRATSDLLTFGLPAELLSMTLQQAENYSFAEGGRKSAFEALLQRGAELAKEVWTYNHWSLVLWKLAATAKAKPDEWSHWWSFEQVLCQLLYRYEREVNLAHRSAIKRIQEHDSTASRAMVLCVSRLERISTEGGRESIAMEVTDGWYRMDAVLDDALIRACRRGALLVGRKIAILGARINSADRDGDDVLDAKCHSQLLLSGNSTSLAQWDARLGFQRHSFVATLRSLSPDGGNVACLQFQVVKLHPIAFTESRKTTSSSQNANVNAPWNEQEEARKQMEWDQRYHEAVEIVKARQDRSGHNLEALADRLETAAEVRNGPTGSPNDDDQAPEDVLEALCDNQEGRSTIIRNLSKAELSATAREAREQAVNGSINNLQAQVEAICPRRQTRAFRILRIVEAPTVPGKPVRECQLTVWDVKDLPATLLKEGSVYRATHLVPRTMNAWSKVDAPRGEIYLSTTRISKISRQS